MRMETTSCDLGPDVIYGVGRSDTLTLIVFNTRPVTRLNIERAQAVAFETARPANHDGD